jgi:hypothetical protein
MFGSKKAPVDNHNLVRKWPELKQNTRTGIENSNNGQVLNSGQIRAQEIANSNPFSRDKGV